MLDTGYRRGTIEGGLAVQKAADPTSIEQWQREVLAHIRLTEMRRQEYAHIENEPMFLAGFHEGWCAAVQMLAPIPALEDVSCKEGQS